MVAAVGMRSELVRSVRNTTAESLGIMSFFFGIFSRRVTKSVVFTASGVGFAVYVALFLWGQWAIAEKVNLVDVVAGGVDEAPGLAGPPIGVALFAGADAGDDVFAGGSALGQFHGASDAPLIGAGPS